MFEDLPRHEANEASGASADPESWVVEKGYQSQPGLSTQSLVDDLVAYEKMASERDGFKNSSAGRLCRLCSWTSRCTLEGEPKREGCVAEVVLSNRFELFVMFIIFIDLLVELTDMTYRDEHSAWREVIEVGILSWYVAELLLRMVTHRSFFFCYTWNVFDVLSVTGGVLEYCFRAQLGLRFARLFRFTRTLRLLHLFVGLTAIKDLDMMLNCLTASFSPVMCTLLLLGLLILVATLLFGQAVQCSQDEFVGQAPCTAILLLKTLLGGEDWGSLFDTLVKESGYGYALVFAAFMIFIIFSFNNVVMSLLVEKAIKKGQPDNEAAMIQRKKEDLRMARDLERVMVAEAGLDKSGRISQERLREVLQKPRVKKYLEMYDINFLNVGDFIHAVAVFSNANCEGASSDLLVNTLVTACLHLKGRASRVEQHTMMFEVKEIRKLLKRALSA